MNILFIIDSLHSIEAGSERQIYKLIDGLVSSGHKVSLILLRHTDFSRRLEAFPCAWESLDIGSIASANAFRTMLHLRHRVKQQKVDVIHAYFPDACILAPLFLKTSNNLLITSRRDMGLIYRGKPAWIYRLLARRTDVVVSNSKAVSDFTGDKENLPASKRRVIGNGIEEYSSAKEAPQIFLNQTSNKLILVANVKPVKRTLDAVIAVSQLIEEGEDLELALVGELQDKQYAEKITALIAERKLEQRIHLTGSLREPRRILSQANIGLLISESEGLSNTIMEYMDAGLPVIATRVGGNPELVANNENGLLIEKGDIHQLKAAILLLINNLPLQKSLGASGKSQIQKEFSVAALIRKHEALYSRASC